MPAPMYLAYLVDLPDDETVVVPPGESVLAGVAGAAGGHLPLLGVTSLPGRML